VLFYVLIVCTVTLPPGVNPIAVDKYIYLSIYLTTRQTCELERPTLHQHYVLWGLQMTLISLRKMRNVWRQCFVQFCNETGWRHSLAVARIKQPAETEIGEVEISRDSNHQHSNTLSTTLIQLNKI